MKEVIEYILASLVILSTIPLYNFIVDQLYSPPELEVDYSFAAMFSENAFDILKEAAINGNLSSPLIDLSTHIRERLSYLGNEYGFQISIVSQGILRSVLQGNTFKIYTIDRGNVSLLTIYSNGSIYNLTLTNPSTIYSNDTYMYETALPDPSQIKFIAIILDTGVYRYVDYYSNGADIVYLGNINNTLYIISDHLFPPNLDKYGLQGVSAKIISYSNSSFLITKETIYREYIDVGINWESWPIYFWEKYNEVKINYFAIYEGITPSLPYYKYKLSILEESATLIARYNITTRFIPFPPFIHIYINPPEIISNESKPPVTYNLSAPLYNLLIVLLKDADGNIHIAVWYPHSIVIGDNVPKDLPVRRITMLRRLGMIDYYITIYMWRRSI